VISPEAS